MSVRHSTIPPRNAFVCIHGTFPWFKTVQDMVDAYNALWKNCKKRLTSSTVLPVGPKSSTQLLASGGPPPDVRLDDTAVLLARKKKSGRQCGAWGKDMNGDGWLRPTVSRQVNHLSPYATASFGFYIVGTYLLVGEEMKQHIPWPWESTRDKMDGIISIGLVAALTGMSIDDFEVVEFPSHERRRRGTRRGDKQRHRVCTYVGYHDAYGLPR